MVVDFVVHWMLDLKSLLTTFGQADRREYNYTHTTETYKYS